MRANGAGLRSRKSMLETLVRHLDMVRLTAAASVLAMMGCTGLIDAPEPTKAELARQLWVTKALPALKAVETNCITCHGGAAPRPMVDFLGGANDLEIRTKVMEFDPAVISIDAPQASRLLNKGQHEGPPLVGQFKSDVQEWIQAEKEAANDDPDQPGSLKLRTPDYAFALCTGGLPPDPSCPVNEIALDDLGNGAGIPGAKISFVVQGVATGIYLTNLKLIPGPQGANIEHPLFVSIPTDPAQAAIADTFDRFFNERKNIMAGAPVDQQQIGGGTAAFVNFPPTNKLAIFFKTAQIFQADNPGGGGGATGCKVPGTFETAARQQFANNCATAGCHATANSNAQSAVDMVGIGQPNATNACNQIRLRTTLTDIPNSAIFLTTAPGNNNHPFTFNNNAAAHTAFRNAVTPWIIAERDAP